MVETRLIRLQGYGQSLIWNADGAGAGLRLFYICALPAQWYCPIVRDILASIMRVHGLQIVARILALLLAGLLNGISQPAWQTNPVEPPMIFIGQPVQDKYQGQWVQAEGVVTFVGRYGNGLNLELSSGEGRMQVTVAQAGAETAELLLKSRIRVQGLCLGVHDSVSGEIVSSLSTPGQDQIQFLQVPQETWQRFPVLSASDFEHLPPTRSAGQIFHLRGRFHKLNEDGSFSLEDKSGVIQMRSSRIRDLRNGAKLDVLARLKKDDGASAVLEAVCLALRNDRAESQSLPVLTTTEQVRWLKPEEARRRYPVKVRVVVTFLLDAPDQAAGNLQDGTGGIYAWHLNSSDPNIQVKPGDYCEIEGETTAGEFSPGINCDKLTVLGRCEFPEPVRPTWDELASGSLDAQWVEVEGIVLATTKQHLDLGTQSGHILCFVPDGTDLERFVNAVVRVRGVVVADFDQSRHIEGVHFNLPSEQFISVETPPLADPFSLPARHIKELLFYDPGKPEFRHEKVLGEIIGVRDNTCYLTDGTNGLRLDLKEHRKLAPGDLVEAVGFPVIENSTEPPLITLREALVRVTGSTNLPSPRRVAAVNLLDSAYDSTLIQVEAQLIHSGIYGTDQLLELQAGARTFFARLPTSSGVLPPISEGSRLLLTGVYAFNNGRSIAHAETGPFELLLDSPDGVVVLEQPSWWTTKHALIVVTGMGLVILLGLVWIGLLRQQVGRRTIQLSTANRSLQAEMAERKRAENELVQTRLEHLLEQERTRIARDIHDELGSSLSQIRLLSEMTLSQNDMSSAVQANSGKISAKALEATHVLDEIVWAVDPHNDTLESLANYLFSFASDYLSLAGIRFRIDAPTRIPHHALTTQVRHQLYMAAKETLTNIVQHARATEVWIRLQLAVDKVSFVVEDNGCGFDPGCRPSEFPGASGLSNMRKRFNEIGGDCLVDSAPGKGACVRFVLPLSNNAKK